MFYNEQTAAAFDDSLKTILKLCISRLYERDRRLKLFPKDFWTVDKTIASRVDFLNLEAISKTVSLSLYQNAPQTIPFEIRAAIFRSAISKERQTR